MSSGVIMRTVNENNNTWKATNMEKEIITNAKSKLRATENICKNCGKRYIIRKSDYKDYDRRKWDIPERCPSCRRAARLEREIRQKAKEDAKWQKIKSDNQVKFEKELKSWRVISYKEIVPIPERTLFIIGNGFDMMHGADSSYYSFRDSLGKNNSLRQNLETFTTVDDIWADFEKALAHINVQFFYSRFNIDNWLYVMGAYEKDAGDAEFYMAAEAATQAVTDIVDDLQKYFSNWVSKLSVGTDRPLHNMFTELDGLKILNFNYTEFAEELYHIPESSICYIHGCRRKRKGLPKSRLILGHSVGASDIEFEKRDHTQVDMRSPLRREMIYAAQEIVLQQLINCDKALTKDCTAIIREHERFFDSVRSIARIITIGHSLSEVDWPYFSEIISQLDDINAVEWYFGCHGLHDLENIEKMIRYFGISLEMVTLFRTDVIKVIVKSAPMGTKESTQKKVQKPRPRCTSPDGKWKVQTIGSELQVADANTDKILYAVEFPDQMKSVFFLPDTEKLFMISSGYPSGIYVFGIEDDSWHLLYELEKDTEYHFFTKSLNRILLYKDKLIFVYNNRVREHSLVDGRKIRSRQFKGARNRDYTGKDVTKFFVEGKKYPTRCVRRREV